MISSSYCGNLRAFLITPTLTEPINYLSEVVESGLPWGLILYGEEEERIMAQSKDPVISTIWENKDIEPLGQYPPVSNFIFIQ